MDNEQKKKNSDARIKANDKYNKANYKNISIRIRPEQAEKIRESAQQHNFSLAQLIIKAVTEYDTNHSDTADTVTASAPEDNTPDQQDTTTSNGSQIISRNTPSRNNSKSAGEAQ